MLALENVETNLFSNLNFAIRQNGIYGIIGRNGSGKSTLYTLINGELRSKSGKIYGFDRVVYVPNLEIFNEELSGFAYLEMLTGEAYQRANILSQKFHADSFLNKKIKTYSLGMKEILAFILTLSLESDLIIIDELMNGLDQGMRDLAYTVLGEVSGDKIILLTSHILEEVFANSEKVFLLNGSSLQEVNDLPGAKSLVGKELVFSG